MTRNITLIEQMALTAIIGQVVDDLGFAVVRSHDVDGALVFAVVRHCSHCGNEGDCPDCTIFVPLTDLTEEDKDIIDLTGDDE